MASVQPQTIVFGITKRRTQQDYMLCNINYYENKVKVLK